MARQHAISPDVLDRFAANTATKEERAVIVRHLLANCPACLQHFRRREQEAFLSQEHVYDKVLEHSLERACNQLRNSTEARRLLTELENHSQNRQQTLVRNHPRFRSAALCDLLLQESDRARKQDLKEALRLAHLGQILAYQLESEPDALEYRARAWAKVGNALRLRGEFFSAERAFKQAQRCLPRGSGNAKLEAQLLSLWASLRFDQRRFEEAIQFSREYGRVSRELGNPHEVGRALVQEAIALIESGKPESATYLLVEAGSMVDTEREPALVLTIGHNIARSYADAGKPREALRIYIELRELYPNSQDTVMQLKGLWLEGQILAGMGHLESAASLFRKIHGDFLELNMTYDAALVALDLAGVLAKIGQFSALVEVVQEALPVFRALGIEREVAASVILLSSAEARREFGA